MNFHSETFAEAFRTSTPRKNLPRLPSAIPQQLGDRFEQTWSLTGFGKQTFQKENAKGFHKWYPCLQNEIHPEIPVMFTWKRTNDISIDSFQGSMPKANFLLIFNLRDIYSIGPATESFPSNVCFKKFPVRSLLIAFTQNRKNSDCVQLKSVFSEFRRCTPETARSAQLRHKVIKKQTGNHLQKRTPVYCCGCNIQQNNFRKSSCDL